MAQRSKAFSINVPGSFFVDQTCIDCGTCYQFLPEVFQDAGEHSFVHQQPTDDPSVLRASMALLACPTGSIGTEDKRSTALALNAFPDPIEGEVSFCGFTSERSFGAWSYFIQRPGGNVLMDSPRAASPLMTRLEALGGVARMVLSHSDDVADHVAFRKQFQCERIMHAADGLMDLERVIRGEDPVELDPDLIFIPTPGHTAGSACLLYRKTFLFTGDHLWWNPHLKRLSASKNYCWFDWKTQLRSLERLLDFEFRWVLPGHGHCHQEASPEAMRSLLEHSLDALRKK